MEEHAKLMGSEGIPPRKILKIDLSESKSESIIQFLVYFSMLSNNRQYRNQEHLPIM